MKKLTTFLAIFLFALTLQGQKVIINDSKAIRVYDTNLPLKAPYTLSVWLDGKSCTSFTLDGTSVDNWADKSGNGNDVSNGNADATRPTYDVNTGRVTFTAANSTFLQSAAFGSALSQPNTIFIVYKITGALSDVEIVFNGITTGHQNAFYYSGSNFNIHGGTLLANGTNDANDNIHCGLFNGASSEYWINGVSKVSGNAGTNDIEGIIIGANFGLTAYADCEMMEVIVFDGAISNTWRDKITAYLADKWDITATTDFKGYILRQD